MADILPLPTSAPNGRPRCAPPPTDPASGSIAPLVVEPQDATVGGTAPPLTDLNAIVARFEAAVRSAAVRPPFGRWSWTLPDWPLCWLAPNGTLPGCGRQANSLMR